MLRRLASRRLLWALGLSLLAHLWVVSGTELSLPDWTAEHDRIEVTLAPPTIPKPPAPHPTRPAEPARPKPAANHHPDRPAKIPPAALPASTMETVNTASTSTVMQEVRPLPPEPISEFVPPVVAEEPPAPLAAPPKRVEIEFAGYNGSKGRGRQMFESLPDGRYRITAEMSMPVILFISGSIEQTSEGIITPAGLQPINFRQKTTGSKPQIATFDWAANRLTLDTGKRTDSLDLPPDTQDFLSFMYQFMFVPPLEQTRLNLVTGKKLRTYIYDFEGEESLQTTMGPLKSWHIGRSNGDGDEKTELWLATEHRHLPVRIRRTEKDGSTIDLIATRLEIIE